MAMDHASFLIFKHVDYHIAMIAPEFEMLSRARKELQFNIKVIDRHAIDRLTESRIELSNGSSITLISRARGDNGWRGYKFNIVFSLFEPIPYELKLSLIPCLVMDPDSILYTVFDR